MANYWTEKEEELCKKWLDATEEKEYQAIYNQLYLKIYKMAQIILNSYFTYNYTMYDQHMNDLVTHAFSKLNRYNKEKNKKWYSFISSVIKNKCFDIVRYKNRDNSLYDADADIKINVLPTYDDDAIEIDNLKNKAIEKFSNEILRLKKVRKNKTTHKNIDNKIIFLTCLIEFLEKFHHFNAMTIAIYVYNNTNLKYTTVSYMCQNYLKTTVGAHQIQYFNEKN
jgi:DNA-directed RNA polymerase specialized sigma24 family protein